MRTGLVLFCTFCAILLFQTNALYAESNFIGGLRNVKGQAFVIRQGRTIAAENGLHIYQGDVLKTGNDSAMGVIFNDNTRISLGPSSELAISKYVFNPAENKFGMLAKILKGTTSYTSGKLTKLSPRSVSFQTPTATIGTRGTSFLVKVDK